jgi:hypothetical protein
MKKSTNESPIAAPAEVTKEKPYEVPVLWEMITMEGGISLLIIYPLVVLFFLKMAYSAFT